MAKESGLGATVAVDDSGTTARAITNDVLSYDISTPRNLQDITGLDKSAMERLQLLADGQVTLTCAFNDGATTGSHLVLKTVISSAVVRTITIVLSGQTLAMEMLATDYPVSRGADGSIGMAVPFSLQNGAVPTWS